MAGVGHPSNVEQILQFIKIGIKDFLDIPVSEDDFKKLVDRLQSQVASSQTSHRAGKKISLYGPKGGVGVTFLTSNLAVAFAKNRQKKVCIIDLSLEFADVCTYMNLEPRYTIKDVLENDKALDISFLEGVMLEHPTGVKVIPAAREDQEQPNPRDFSTLKAVFALLVKHYDYILIDTGHIDTALLQGIFSDSDAILLVGNPDVPSLKGLVSLVRKLGIIRFDPEKIKVMINRFNSKNQIDVKEFEKMTNHKISFLLPNNFPVCIEAVNTGQTVYKINDKSDLAKKIDELSEAMKILLSAESSEAKADSISMPPPGSMKSMFK